ncbi:hypothetical protein Tco_1265560 [Tanacetum coccineum]
MSTYLKNMAGYKHSQLKNKSLDDIQKLFDKSTKRVNTFVDMDTELVEGSEKRVGEELMQESAKKQKVHDDTKEAKLKDSMEIVFDEEEVAIDVIPLATKPPSIVDSKIHKEGQTSYYQITRVNGSYKMYLVFKDAVWRNLQGNKVLVWKLFDSYRVHFVRLQNLHIYMLVEKKYPLTPATITDMLNRKLQADHWNEMCYQLLKLITKQLKNQ